MNASIPALLFALAVGAAACGPPPPPAFDFSRIHVGMSVREVDAIWGQPIHMYKLDESAEGCVERHTFGIWFVPGKLPRPATVDFDAKHRVCAVGAVDIMHSEAPLLATQKAPEPAPPPAPAVAVPDDVVFLKNGGRVRGKIMEESPTGVSIQMDDGVRKKISRGKIDRIEYGK